MVDLADLDAVARQLGREPRGCPRGRLPLPQRGTACCEDDASPSGRHPLPTLYYLTHPLLTRLQAGWSPRASCAKCPRDCPRILILLPPTVVRTTVSGGGDAIESLGTTFTGGGMPDRVKCLHALMAHLLAKGRGVNPFGDEALARLAADPAMAGILAPEVWT